MGRKSTRENKTVYQIAREKQGLTLEKGSCQQFFAQMAKPSRADIKIPSEPRAGVFRE